MKRARTKESLSVGQVSERSGVPISTLHFYEKKGLIRSSRNAGNQRRFPRHTLRRLAVIRIAQSLGISLAEIRENLAELPHGHPPTAADWERLSVKWRTRLDSRIQQMIALRDKLNTCIGCGCLSVKDCPLRNPDDLAATLGPGARAFDP